MVVRPCWLASPTTNSLLFVPWSVVRPCWIASQNYYYSYYGGRAVLGSQLDPQ